MNWQSTQRVLYRNARIVSGGADVAGSLLIDGDRIAWIGDGEPASTQPTADSVVDAQGATITAGLVDAHVDALRTGAEDELAELRQHAARRGLVAVHDFSTTPAASIGDHVVERPGTLVFPFRAAADPAAFGVWTTATAEHEWRSAVESGLPLAIAWDGGVDPEAFTSAMTALIARIGDQVVRRAVIRFDVSDPAGPDVPAEASAMGCRVVGAAVEELAATANAGSVAYGSFSTAPDAPWDLLAGSWASPQAVLARCTSAGWRAVGRAKVGTLAPGRPAHLAIWSTGLAGAPEAAQPTCLRTIIAGTVVHDAGMLAT